MNRRRLALLAPLVAVLALLCGLTGTASAAFNQPAQNPHYGNFLLWESEASNLHPSAIPVGTGNFSGGYYDFASGRPPWTMFDPLGLATTMQGDGESSSSTEIEKPLPRLQPQGITTPSAKDLMVMATTDTSDYSPPRVDYSHDSSLRVWAAGASASELTAAAESGAYGKKDTRMLRDYSQSASDAAHDWKIFSSTANGVAFITQPETLAIKGFAAMGLAIKGMSYADDLARAPVSVGKFDVGPYNEMKGQVPGLDAHHVGQNAVMKDLIPGYDPATAPSILVPKVGHTIKGPNGIVSRSTKGFTNPRDVIARDIKEMRRVYPEAPNSKLQELIQANKDMYPSLNK